ncbi:hypothetical protein KR054_012535 [Drosophila jambulina]|nr:hypothetical protein KR054_012535 [Drosophila jambulina]
MLINVCRVCGKSTLCPKALELFKLESQETLRRIYVITGIRLQQIPGAPNMVCFCCQTDLNSAILFRRHCIQEQKKWVPIQKEAEAEEENFKAEVENLMAGEEALKAGEQEEEDEEDTASNPRRSGRRRGPVEPLHTVDIVVKLPETTVVEESTGGGNDNETEQLAEIPQDKEGETDPEYSIPPKRQVHKCDTCGIVKKNKASLVRHEYIHRGEKPFPCKECSKSFLSGTELRCHMLSHHTQEPPFPCRYCDRRYFSVVGRRKHERVHTNERPFVCDQCGKAFTRVCILRAHMQSHTGQRMFRCDICDRSFTLKKHLVTHYISNTHKRNAEMAEEEPTGEDTFEAGLMSNDNFTENLIATQGDLEQSQFDLLCVDVINSVSL